MVEYNCLTLPLKHFGPCQTLLPHFNIIALRWFYDTYPHNTSAASSYICMVTGSHVLCVKRCKTICGIHVIFLDLTNIPLPTLWQVAPKYNHPMSVLFHVVAEEEGVFPRGKLSPEQPFSDLIVTSKLNDLHAHQSTEVRRYHNRMVFHIFTVKVLQPRDFFLTMNLSLWWRYITK